MTTACHVCGTYAGTIPHAIDGAPLCDRCARVVTVDDPCTECGQRVTVAQHDREPIFVSADVGWRDGAGHTRCLINATRGTA